MAVAEIQIPLAVMVALVVAVLPMAAALLMLVEAEQLAKAMRVEQTAGLAALPHIQPAAVAVLPQ